VMNDPKTVLNEILGSVRTELKAAGCATTSGQAEWSARTWVHVIRATSSWINEGKMRSVWALKLLPLWRPTQ